MDLFFCLLFQYSVSNFIKRWIFIQLFFDLNLFCKIGNKKKKNMFCIRLCCRISSNNTNRISKWPHHSSESKFSWNYITWSHRTWYFIQAETHCNIDNFSLKNCSSIPESSVRFEHVIGEGYFGIVYLAYYNGHRTAAKKIKSDFNLNRQFIKEAKVEFNISTIYRDGLLEIVWRILWFWIIDSY